MKKTNPLSVKDIENIAKKFRTYFNIDKNSYFPILEVIDTLFEKKLLSYQVVNNDTKIMDDSCVAMYNANENFIYIKESVFEECEKCKYYENADWQANEFAGQILIPTKYLDLDEETIQSYFRVSLECALTRKAKAKKRQKKKN